MKRNIEVVLNAYHQNYLNGCKLDEDWWAYQYLHCQVQEEPEQAFENIQKLVMLSTDKEFLAYVGADIFEDLVKEQGEVLFAKIEAESMKNRRFMYAFCFVWVGESYSFVQSFRQFKERLVKSFGITDEDSAEKILLKAP